MRKVHFEAPHGLKDFGHHAHPAVAAVFTVTAALLLLFVMWVLVKDVVSWALAALPSPLAWGNWPISSS